MEVCRGERVRPRLALVALAGLLLGQTLAPCGILLANVQAAELRLKANAAAVKPASAPIPLWAKELEKRAAQEQRARKLRLAQFRPTGKNDKGDGGAPEDPECLDCEVDLAWLDVSEVPTETALRRAGGVDGALYPMRRAEPEELGLKLDRLLKRVGVEGGLRGQLPPKDPRFAALKTAKERYGRAREINTLFGRAVKAWQQDDRAGATNLFGQYMKQYPKSPWAGEAYLHLGVAAKEDGQLIEAMEIFQTIVDKSSDKPNKKLREVKRERKQRGGGPLDSERDADIANALAGAATLEEAVVKLDAADESDDDDESFEIHMKAKAQLADVEMLMGHYNAAQQKLSEIVRDDLNWRRRTWASSQWQRASFLSQNAATLMACGPQALALVLVSQGKDDDKAQSAKAPRAQGFSLAELKTLAHRSGVEMNGFQADASELAALPLPAILHYDFGPDLPAKGKAAARESNGHFVVLQGVDEASQMVRVYDPLQGRSERMSYAQLGKQWSGQGLVLQKPRVRLAVAPLGVGAMKRALGGQMSSSNRNVGDSGNNAAVAGGAGDPTVEINRFSMNQHIEQTVMSYQPSQGPAVNITLNFNSQDALSQYQRFGNKWMFNFTIYAYQSGNRVYVVMPDGSRDEYLYDPANPNVFKGLPGNFSKVEKSAAAYTLVFQDGSRWTFAIAGAAVNFVTRFEDPWQKALDLHYDFYGHLMDITDADGRSTTFGYNAQGQVESVRDPFGRMATFSYFNNHLYGCTNMEGAAFAYRYGGPLVSQITTPRGAWGYSQAGPNAGTGSIAVTTTNPLGDSMTYSYDGSTYYSAETDYKRNITYFAFAQGASEELRRVTIYPYNTSESSEFNDLGLVNKAFDERGFVSEFTYNNQGQPLTAKDPKGNVTTYVYDPSNGVDVTGVINANNVQTMNATYNAQHQPTSVTDLSADATTTFTYTPWGAPETVIDPLNRGTRYVYGTAGDELRRLVQVQRSDAPPTPGGPRNWVTVSSFLHDAAGRLIWSTDAAGVTLGYANDLADRVMTVAYPDGTYEENIYLNGLPVRFKDRAGRYSYTEFDALGRARRSYTQDAQNNVAVGTTLMDYDKNSNPSVLTDSSGKTTTWTYDARDRPTSKTYHSGEVENFGYSYDLVAYDGKASYGYDRNGNVTVVNYAGSANDVKFEYNRLDDVSRVLANPENTVYSYDNYGRLTAQGPDYWPTQQTYTYDKLQRRQTYTIGDRGFNDAHTQTYTYDALDRLASINSTGRLGTGLTTYTYQGNSDRLTELNHPNGTKTRQQYDALGRLTHVFNSANGDLFHNRYAFNYDTRDLKVNMQSRTGSSSPLITTQWAYDALDQIKQERVTGGFASTPYTTNYNYDAMGNRLQTERTITASNGAPFVTTTTGTANDVNQLTSLTTTRSSGPATSATLFYDPIANTNSRGNLTRVVNNDGTSTQYQYDSLDRLVGILYKNAAGVAQTRSEFIYDYLSRRVITREYSYDSSRNTWAATKDERRLYDGMDVVQERNFNNQRVTAQLVRDGSVGGILSRTTATGDKAFYGYDGNGNVTLLTDASGTEVARYRYDAFGVTLEAIGTKAADNPYRFSTKEQHGPSGLVDFGFRFYSPGMGRWINRDPLGEAGGINLYAMVGNNPVNDVDEYGLQRQGARALGALTSGARASFQKLGIPAENILKSYDKKATKKSGETHVALYGRANTLDIMPNRGLSKKEAFRQLTPWLATFRANGWAAWIRGDDADESGYEPHIHAVFMGSYNKNNAWQVEAYKQGRNGLRSDPKRDRMDTTNPIPVPKKKVAQGTNTPNQPKQNPDPYCWTDGSSC